MSDSPVELETPQRRRSWWVRAITAGAVLLTGWHVFASFLWISPYSELRNIVPGDTLRNYMLPWFGQSWSVFAPEPINGDYFFKVRATILDDAGKNETTEWIDATAVELSMSQHNLFPPRASDLSSQQATKFLNQWKTLNDEQKEIVALGFYKGESWLGRMRASLNELGSKDQVSEYIVQERYTTAYATQVAYAIWGEDRVQQVQFEIYRQDIVPFEERHNPEAQRPAPISSVTGWRGTLVMDGQSNEDFARVFRKTYESLKSS